MNNNEPILQLALRAGINVGTFVSVSQLWIIWGVDGDNYNLTESELRGMANELLAR